MSQTIDFKIPELKLMKKYPAQLFFKGNLALLKKRKVSIVGTRKPNSYTKKITYRLSQELAKRDVAVVSGAAIGVDAISHVAASAKNTIAVVANGLDIRYPSINNKLIQSIENDGLVLSSYEDGQKARNYTFVQRNEIVVSLGEILIVTQADENSGTLTSINYALDMGKEVYTIPHHIGDSIATQKLLDEGLIKPIYDIDNFLSKFGSIDVKKDSIDLYLESNPLYDDALKKIGDKLFELELEGKFTVENGYIKPQ